MPSDTGEGPLVGRVAELAVLRTARQAAEDGANSAVFLTGESGVGKTRLLVEAVAEMRAAGLVVLSGQCLDIGDASPLYPLRQALRRFQPEQGVPGVAATHAARELLAVLGGDTGGSDGGAGALLERLSSGLGAMADGRTLALVVDDLQWADQTTRQLLLYL